MLSLPVFSFTAGESVSGAAAFLYQQDHLDIRGQVVAEEDGMPLPGVNVVVKGVPKGAVTDMDGYYSLDNVASDATLVFSYMGFVPQEIQVNGKAVINAIMKSDLNVLDEVVVIGYGEVNRKDLTGSVGQVNVDELKKAPVSSYDEALAGRIAGVLVTSNDGQPGSVPNIVIRGGNSITQDNSPLYVVDGFPVEDNDNSFLNPDDIASIDILKDASATAIYGARGANGVVVITTKSGNVGKPVIEFDTYTGFQEDLNRLELLDGYEFVKLQQELSPEYATRIYLDSVGRTLDDYKNLKTIDWYKESMQTAPIQSYNLSMRGGTKQTRYSVSGSFFDQKGIFINTGFKRYQARLRLDQKINDKVDINLNVNYANVNRKGTIVSEDDGGANANIMNNIWAYRPVTTPLEDDIEFEDQLLDPEVNPGVQFRVNPKLQLENSFRERISENLFTNIRLNYRLLDGLKLSITGGVNMINQENNAFDNSKTRSGSTIFPFSIGVNGSRRFIKKKVFTNENTLTYDKQWDNRKHKLNAVIGFTQQLDKFELSGMSAFQLPNENLGLNGLDQGTPREIFAEKNSFSLQSFLGRVNYTLMDKFLFTASFRADGSSKFAPGNRWAYFPSGAFAYKLGQEDFIKKSNVISDLKLRVSYGKTGNNRVSTFAYLSELNSGLNNGYSFGNEIPRLGAITNVLTNPELKWETTDQVDTGVDLSLWNGRFNFTADYYYKETNDLLLRAQLPNSSGYLRAFKNVGSVSNEGLEFSFNSINISKPEFQWSTNFNISFNRNKVLALTENQEELTSSITIVGSVNNSVYTAKIGEPVAQFYGLEADGLYQVGDFDLTEEGDFVLRDEFPANGAPRANIQPGDAKYVDQNGDGEINLDDYTVIGNPNPDFYGGFSNNFRFKGFDLNVLFQYSYGNDVFNANKVNFENGRFIGTNSNQFASMADRWTFDNQDTDIPRLNGLGANFYSSRLVEDGSFIRLKTVSLGYNFGDHILETLQLNALRIYVSGQNLYTWTKYTGVDPEVSTRHTPLTPGFDLSPYPRMRTIIMGVNVSF
ncbi:SusC/RagA family TonB-linked outer membrane protein [Sinomicrobium soli]|nr:SusC/RagA family TonB-linked outer membrane protein [Sinomicrobium sp. N-1-3-6]